MTINKKLFATCSLLGAVVMMAMAPIKDEAPKYTNLKVLPKNITEKQLHDVMEEWEHALGARCGFCHTRNNETKKMDWAADGKPEKDMARQMYKMTQAINKKYFHAKKDSTNMILESGVNCNTCHRGTSHPEVVKASEVRRGPGSPPPGGQGVPASGTPSAGVQGGTTPPSGK